MTLKTWLVMLQSDTSTTFHPNTIGVVECISQTKAKLRARRVSISHGALILHDANDEPYMILADGQWKVCGRWDADLGGDQ